MTEIIVPIKDLSHAKQRLSGVLSPLSRAGLVMAMLQDLLSAASTVDGCRIWLIASDDVILDIGRSFGAHVIREPKSRGYNEAVAHALATVTTEKPVAVLPGDLPLATSSEIAALTGSLDNTPTIRIAGARDGCGTNGLFLSQPGLLSPAFGTDSFSRHTRASRAIGVQPEHVRAPGLAFDIDTPTDLVDFVEASTGGATGRFLSGLADSNHYRILERGAA